MAGDAVQRWWVDAVRRVVACTPSLLRLLVTGHNSSDLDPFEGDATSPPFYNLKLLAKLVKGGTRAECRPPRLTRQAE